MRVLIVNTNRERSPYTLLPIGACCVAAAARNAGHDTRFLDLTFERNPIKQTLDFVTSFKPDVVGLSIRNIDNCDASNPLFYLTDINDIVKACRIAGVGYIVIGGAAVTTAAESVLRFTEADYAVIGEGEAAFPRLLDAIFAGDHLTSVPGVAAICSSSFKCNSPAPSQDLSSFPNPNPENWLNLSLYKAYDAAMSVQTKRGCAFRCSYCLYQTIEGEGIRFRDPDWVAEEVLRSERLGFRSVEFVDSVFNVPEEHAINCCEAILHAGSHLPLQTSELNPSGCSSDMVKAMNAAGFISIGCTAESGSDQMLRSLRKGFTSDHLRQAALELSRSTALRMWIFMFGGPGETESTVRETTRFMEDSLTDRDIVYVSRGIRILPGTELNKQAVAEGVVSEHDNLLLPQFYFSPQITPERVMSILYSSRFPSANIVSLSDGNNRLLPAAQRWARMIGLRPPYWRLAPMWNRARSLWHFR